MASFFPLSSRFTRRFTRLLIGAGLSFFCLGLLPAASALACKDTGRQLRGSYELTQSKGGLWGYMEKVTSMKKDSLIGFQIDAKMQRLVVYFETLCEEGKPVSREKYDKIVNALDQGRQIINKTPGRTPIEKIRGMIVALNEYLDKTLGEFGI